MCLLVLVGPTLVSLAAGAAVCSEQGCLTAAREARVRYVNPMGLSTGEGCVHDTLDQMAYLSSAPCEGGWNQFECLTCAPRETGGEGLAT